MDLINGKALTFLRHALPEDLAPINQVEVALSMGDSFVATGLTIEDDLLSRAAKATKAMPIWCNWSVTPFGNAPTCIVPKVPL